MGEIDVPYEVSSVMYGGTSEKIDRLMRSHEIGRWSDYDSYSYLNLRIVLDWYRKHCVISSDHLEESYRKLTEAIEGKYFIYDYSKNHRFTLRCDLGGGIIKEERNCLVSRQLVKKKMIVVGHRFKYKGFHVHIVDASPSVEEDHGLFIAETISMKELLKIKKGEN
ncbi:hypothetical protein AAXB25_14745 [Paenibacillus lautus]|uniref:hypothetical protein n=1 Tax=Paenibacillus lautus TaxID=1401 RepID=UPI003D29BEB8